MDTMNKQHEYRGYTFNIKVELNAKVEKCLNGKRVHRITLNNMGISNYYRTHYAESNMLSEIIDLMVKDSELWVDNQIDGGKSEDVLLLESLGFK